MIVGLDHTRAFVYEHCKKLLQNLILLACAQEQPSVSRMLLGYRNNLTDSLKLIADDKELTLVLGELSENL
jgi:hypothetical protein